MPSLKPTQAPRGEQREGEVLIDTISADEASLALAGVITVDRRYGDARRQRSFMNELASLAQGLSAQQSANEQDINVEAVSARRRKAKEAFGVKTAPELVVAAIQLGYVGFAPQEDPKLERLTARQTAVLHLTALGWSTTDIAQRYGITDDRVTTHYESVRRKLNALNTKHSMLRAFEVGIFRLGEPILDPEELADKNNLDLMIGGVPFTTKGLGLIDQTELEILRIISTLDRGVFSQHDIYFAGFFQEAANHEVRENAYKRSMGNVRQKLNSATDLSVLDRVRIGGRRQYAIRQPLTITDAGKTYILPLCPDSSIKTEKTWRPKVQKPKLAPPAAESPPATEKVEGSLSLIINILDPSELAEFDDQLLKALRSRKPEEVLENGPVKLAVEAIINNDRLNDYYSRVVVPLRFGAMNGKSNQTINRNGQYIRLQELMGSCVPAYRGLDVASTAQVVGISPLSVLQLERKFIASFVGEFPALKTLGPIIEEQILEHLAKAA